MLVKKPKSIRLTLPYLGKIIDNSILFICLLTNALIAGPQSYFILEDGSTVKGEVLAADDTYFYCQRVYAPKSPFIIEIEKSPYAIRNLVRLKQIRGEIPEPQNAISPPKVNDTANESVGRWRYSPMDRYESELESYQSRYTKDEYHVLSLYSVDETALFVIRYRNEHYSIYFKFLNKYIGQVRKKTATYQFDQGEIHKRMWETSRLGRALFSNEIETILDQLKTSQQLKITSADFESNPINVIFDVRGFEMAFDRMQAIIDAAEQE
ncbi:MAG TPA: hypothetical protein DCX06_05285 [Opitutae bacterium]|nr:hypothetical protein [Opitutae bacterium]